MKRVLFLLLGSMLMSLSLAGCCTTTSCGSCNSCAQPAPITSECNCTDPNAGRNRCMSKEKYCEAFGNVGRGGQ